MFSFKKVLDFFLTSLTLLEHVYRVEVKTLNLTEDLYHMSPFKKDKTSYSLLSACYLLRFTYYSLLRKRLWLLYWYFFTFYSLFDTFYFLFVTFYSLFVTLYSLLVTSYSLLVTFNWLHVTS